MSSEDAEDLRFEAQQEQAAGEEAREEAQEIHTKVTALFEQYVDEFSKRLGYLCTKHHTEALSDFTRQVECLGEAFEELEKKLGV